MKKADYSEELSKLLEGTKVVSVEVNDEMKKSFISYAMAVNVSRAIPDVRDGMKPVHRRIIYTMGEMGLTNDKPYKKCARIVGEVMGKFHPHGDSAIYDALVRLAQDFSINCPLVDGHGNFGSVDGDPAAAQRYTEARLSKISAELLRDINKNTVDFYPNYDGEEMQPRVLPSRFPNLLVNGSDGIAVGMATNIPPHNLGEVIDGVVAMIDNPDIDIEELIKIIPAPDFPTRGIIMAGSGIRQAYLTGKGNIVVRAKTEIEEYNEGTRSRIIVTELPYQVNKAKLIISIADLVKEKRIEGISNIKDESDRNGMRIVIEIKKDFNAQVVLNMLFKHTQLQMSDGIIMLALVGNSPRILNLKEIIYYYLEHQKEVITRRTKYDLERAQERAHILEGLVIALNNIDEVIHIIKSSKDKYEATSRLMERFGLTEVQTNAILDMRLQRLTNMEVDKILAELEALRVAIEDYKDILAHESRVLDIIKKEILEIKEKYAEPRKSEISLDYSSIDIADLIAKEDVVVSLTHYGYVKRQPLTEYRSQRRGGKGVTGLKTKEEDYVENMIVCNTHEKLLCFTNKGRVYSMMCYEIPEGSRQAKGRAIINLLQLSDGEKVTAIIPTNKEDVKYLIMATKKGLIKKTKLEEFDSIRKVGKISIELVDDDTLISVHATNGENEIMVASNDGKIIRFNENDVRSMGRTARGVKCMNLKPNDYMVDMLVVNPEAKVLTITENGYGKRTNIDEYRVQGRAGMGIKAGNINEKTGKVVNIKQVTDDNDIMLITNSGVIIRFHATDINVIGRASQGVIVMRTGENEKVVSIAITDREEDEPEESVIDASENQTAVEQNAEEVTLSESAETQTENQENSNLEIIDTDNQ